MQQRVFSLALPPVFSEANFYAAACNREAQQWVMRWPDWPAHALLLYGPKGAGKSHLAHLWAARTKAQVFSCGGNAALSPEAMRGNWLVEDIHLLTDEKTLLHLLNISREQKTSLLLTSAVPPAQLPFKLPDLTSRLLALPATGIEMPDEETLAAVLRKQFADRQLKVEEDVIAFILPRMERSFAGLSALVDALDQQSLAEQRNLTIPFVKRVMG